MAKQPLYTIVEIPNGAAESTEQLGTKFKFWYSDPSYGLTLFKEGRPGTGENWAEKIACELATLIELPHARYEFAHYEGKEGVISPTIVTQNWRLVHGNELLATIIKDYGENPAKPYSRKEHTIRRVLSYFRASSELVGTPPEFKQTKSIFLASDVFIGYLMFDAWIANQDRHDENWGILRNPEGNSFLAPSYDHGSSMGRNETDAKRMAMISTRDMGQHISKYITKARSALYPHQTQPDERINALSTLEAFIQATRLRPDAASEWKERLAAIKDDALDEVINKVPSALMTDISKSFTGTLLKLNRDRILNCEK